MTNMDRRENESAEANPPTIQRLFEDSSPVKPLDFLTLYRDFDYSKMDRAKNSSVSFCLSKI